MNQYVIDTRIKDGSLLLKGLPFIQETDVKVIVIPKIDLKELSFSAIKNLTKTIKGNLSDDIVSARERA